MNFTQFQSMVTSVNFGKKLPEAIYLHKCSIAKIPEQLQSLVKNVSAALKIDDKQWHILKLSKRDFKLSLLSYPTFFDEPYPPLHHSYTIDLAKLQVREADYTKSDNPPILHRRETFVADNHPQTSSFKTFTVEGENIGLYESTRTIGFKQSWERLIRKKGYYLDDDGHIQALTSKPFPIPDENTPTGEIDRHKTALSRDKLSLPLFLIAQRGYLKGGYSVLDYGCGRGDDLRELEKHNIDAIGWDPVHNPDPDLEPSDIVNLGYVINVIEDIKEREETLLRAYSYANKLIVISAMLGSERIYERFKPYKDGVITSRNTFQRYYAQGELQHYIESVLSENAIALNPGIFVVFKDKIEEQKYLFEKQRTRHQWRQLSTRPPKIINEKRSKDLFERHKTLFSDFWYTCLDLARLPANDEFEHSEQIRTLIGSHSKAFALCHQYYDEAQFQQAQKGKEDDLAVYFALSFFEKRDAYSRMPQSMQRDIKTFFDQYSEAREIGKELLFSTANPVLIYNKCVEASNTIAASYLDGQHSLTIHKKFLPDLPKELRIYVGCATQLYGELEEIDLIKIHIRSGKVSLMTYDGFDTQPLPLLKERIKIKLREQDIDFFDYVGEFTPQPLYNKSLLIDESFEDYKKQKSFDKRLTQLNVPITGLRGPRATELKAFLATQSQTIKGYRLFKLN